MHDKGVSFGFTLDRRNRGMSALCGVRTCKFV